MLLTCVAGMTASLGTVGATTSELTLAVEVGAVFSAGGAIFGSSVGVSSSNVYTIETSSTTTYSATVGDIAPADYFDWQYETGMVVYQDDATGPLPFQVMRTALGSGLNSRGTFTRNAETFPVRTSRAVPFSSS